MKNIYNDKLSDIIGALGATPDPAPAGNIYVARLDEIIVYCSEIEMSLCGVAEIRGIGYAIGNDVVMEVGHA